MRHCNCLVIISFALPLAALGLAAGMASANPVPPIVWHDDMEGDVSGWTSVDLSAGVAPHFHWDTYLSFEGDYSWWCGTFDYDADGGYGNSWDDRLELPPISVNPVPVEHLSWAAVKMLYSDGPSSSRGGRARDGIMPVLTFAYRYDSEIGYDYTYVQAESSGVYVNLNRGYDGRQPWTDIGPYGFDLSNYDDPLRVRFRFISDGAWSDEDGLYLSAGGGFAVDNVKVYDFATGDVLFFDSEPGAREGECTPAVPDAAGDYWHLIDRECPAYSDPHSWWCGDDADTSLVPPNLNDALFSPLVEISYAVSCTCYLAMHFAVPTVDNDYLTILGTMDGVNYYSFGGWWGDFGSCDGWGGTALMGFALDQFGYGYSQAGVAFVMHTTDNGCGPGDAGDAGMMLDDLWICANNGQPWDGKRTAALYAEEPHLGSARFRGMAMDLRR